MSTDTPSSKEAIRDSGSGFRVPFAMQILDRAPVVGEAARKAVERGIVKRGVSGTGKRLADLHGAARFTTTLSVAGGGSRASGGGGMAAGAPKLLMVQFACTGLLIASVLGTEILIRRAEAAAREQPHSDVALCASCKGVLPLVGVNRASLACPHCGHLAENQK